MRFDSYHPTINMIYFTAAILMPIISHHPVFLLIGYLSAFLYSVKLGGLRTLVFDLCLIPLTGLYAGIYAGYHHFGVTDLGQNLIGNSITWESLVYGWMIGVTIATELMLFSCVFRIVSSDKIGYLLGRVSPKLSLFLAILLRSVPRIRQQAAAINTVQCGIGRGINQGSTFQRLRNLLRVFSITITWALENFVESATSMKSRGYLLSGRTAFSIYRFDNRDRAYVLLLTLCLVLLAMAILLDQTAVSYDPVIVVNRITGMSYIFYAACAVLYLSPLALQLFGEVKYRLHTNPHFYGKM